MSPEVKLWYLQNNKLFSNLSKQEMEMLDSQTVMKSPKKNDFVYFEDDAQQKIYILKKGRIKIGSYTEDGRELIHAMLGPGEVFGETGLIEKGKHNDYAKADSDDVVLCEMPIEKMNELMQGNMDLSLKVTRLIGLKLKKTEQKLKDLIGKDARTRIVDLIKDFTQELGKEKDGEILVRHHLTHQDMANITATSRQTVTTVLNELKSTGALDHSRKAFVVKDSKKLL